MKFCFVTRACDSREQVFRPPLTPPLPIVSAVRSQRNVRAKSKRFLATTIKVITQQQAQQQAHAVKLRYAMLIVVRAIGVLWRELTLAARWLAAHNSLVIIYTPTPTAVSPKYCSYSVFILIFDIYQIPQFTVPVYFSCFISI